MPTGTHIYLAIQAALDEQLHALINKRDEEAFRILPELVGPFGIDPRSRRLQGAVKALRTAKQLSPKEIAEHFKARLRELSDAPNEVVYRFATEAIKLLGELDARLFMDRSEISTVSAVLRPLDARWVQRLKTAGEIFDYDGIHIAENSLRNRMVIDKRDLDQWFGNMYDAFEKFCVFHPGESKMKPMGMIRESNRRMYSRNWISWTSSESNILRVLELAADLEAERPIRPFGIQRQPLPPYGTYIQTEQPQPRHEYSPVVRQEEYPLIRPIADDVEVVNEKCTIVLTSAANPDETSTKSWPDVATLKKNVRNWLLVTAETWGDEGSFVNIKLHKSQDDSSVSVQSRTPEQAVASILKLVDL